MSATALGVWATVSTLFCIISVFWAGWNASDGDLAFAFGCCISAFVSGMFSISFLMQIGGAS